MKAIISVRTTQEDPAHSHDNEKGISMKSAENLKITGRLNIVVQDSQGHVKNNVEVDNLVVTEGLTYIASRMADASKTVMSHIQVGTGTGAAAAGDTEATFTTAGLTGATRKALTSTTPGVTNIVYVATFAAGEATGPITEAGVVNAATDPCDLLCRTVFAVINKGADDTMTITWTVTLAAV